MRYSNTDFNVVYIDPSIAIPGDGTTPETALNALPMNASDIADNTCYLIRRTAVENSLSLPQGLNTNLTNILFLGMPKPNDQLFSVVPVIAQTSWGNDVYEYANISSDSSSNRVLSIPNLRQFLFNRIYLYRISNGGSSGGYYDDWFYDSENWLFYFERDDNYLCASIENCKFGRLGVDLDNTEYVANLDNNSKLNQYFYFKNCRILNIKNCVFNHFSNSSSIEAEKQHFLNVENIRCFSATASNESYSYILKFGNSSNSEGEMGEMVTPSGYECNVRNVELEIVMNGNNTNITPFLLITGKQTTKVEGIDISIRDSANPPSNLYLRTQIIELCGLRLFTVRDIDIDLHQLSGVEGCVFKFNNCYSSSRLPGIEREIRNITITLAEPDNNGNYPVGTIGNSVSTLEGIHNRMEQQAVLYLNFNAEDGSQPQFVTADNITINHSSGNALWCNKIYLTNAHIRGAFYCRYSACELESLHTWFPCSALWADHDSQVRVKELTVNTANQLYPIETAQYDVVRQGADTFSQVFVDSSNALIKPLEYNGGTDFENTFGCICSNERENGHFCARWYNGIADTWNVYRSNGSSLASIKLYNNKSRTMNTMILGQRPFNGIMLASNYTGKQLLKMYIATKGFASEDELYRRFMVSVSQNSSTGLERCYWSNVHGVWRNDTSSVWVNDDNLSSKCLEIPIETSENDTLNVRIYFSWYSSSGFIYIDPGVILEPVSSE